VSLSFRSEFPFCRKIAWRSRFISFPNVLLPCFSDWTQHLSRFDWKVGVAIGVSLAIALIIVSTAFILIRKFFHRRRQEAFAEGFHEGTHQASFARVYRKFTRPRANEVKKPQIGLEGNQSSDIGASRGNPPTVGHEGYRLSDLSSPRNPPAYESIFFGSRPRKLF